MKQLFPPLTLSSTGKEMTVSGYPTQKPCLHTWPPNHKNITGGKGCYSVDEYNEAIEDWQAYKITVKVQEESIKSLKWATRDLLLKNTHADNVRLHTKLQDGIDISSLADRLEYYEEKRCTNSCDWPKCTFKDCMEKHPEKWAEGKAWFVRLLPAEQPQTAICPTCGIERKVSVDKDESGCFLAVKEDQEQNLNNILEFHKAGHSNKAILGNFNIIRK